MRAPHSTAVTSHHPRPAALGLPAVIRVAGRLLLLLSLMAVLTCRAAATCPQCGRDQCNNLTFTIQLVDGKRVETCCPRCGLHYIASSRPAVAGLSVRDFETAEQIDADRASFVEGSDITPCITMHAPGPSDERGCCFNQVYDRCLPSLLAFHSKAAAEGFAREHGGVVKRFAEIRAAQGPAPHGPSS